MQSPSFPHQVLSNSLQCRQAAADAAMASESGRSPETTNACCCSTCGRLDATSVCSRCHVAWYCSPACQRNDWKSHKDSCKEAASQELLRQEQRVRHAADRAEASSVLRDMFSRDSSKAVRASVQMMTQQDKQHFLSGAVIGGDQRAATFLLAGGADPAAIDPVQGASPVQLAASLADPGILALLIASAKRGGRMQAALTARDNRGLLVLHRAAMESSTPPAAQAACVRMLLEAGAEPDALCSDSRGDTGRKTALTLAVLQGAAPAVLAALLEAGADPNFRDPEGTAPLDAIQVGF